MRAMRSSLPKGGSVARKGQLVGHTITVLGEVAAPPAAGDAEAGGGGGGGVVALPRRRVARVTRYDRYTGTHALRWRAATPRAAKSAAALLDGAWGAEERGVDLARLHFYPNQDRNWLEGLLRYDTFD